jgi:Domain of unknown function (DUF5664)
MKTKARVDKDKKPTLVDMKEALGNSIKPDITHITTAFLNYNARACEYGSEKYQRGNYRRRLPSRKDDFNRALAYLRALLSHTTKAIDSMSIHLSRDPELVDYVGMARAVLARDTDTNGIFPASGLPHLAHAAASMVMLLTQATDAGLLPLDPGCPWRQLTEETE